MVTDEIPENIQIWFLSLWYPVCSRRVWWHCPLVVLCRNVLCVSGLARVSETYLHLWELRRLSSPPNLFLGTRTPLLPLPAASGTPSPSSARPPTALFPTSTLTQATADQNLQRRRSGGSAARASRGPPPPSQTAGHTRGRLWTGQTPWWCTTRPSSSTGDSSASWTWRRRNAGKPERKVLSGK